MPQPRGGALLNTRLEMGFEKRFLFPIYHPYGTASQSLGVSFRPQPHPATSEAFFNSPRCFARPVPTRCRSRASQISYGTAQPANSSCFQSGPT